MKKIRTLTEIKGQTLVQVLEWIKSHANVRVSIAKNAICVNYFSLEAIYSFAIKLVSFKLARIILFEVSYGMNEMILINRLI